MPTTRILTPILTLLATYTVAWLQLNVTAIGAQNGVSTLECWEVDSPFYASGDPVVAGARTTQHRDLPSFSWSVSPPGQYVGPHNAPYNQ